MRALRPAALAILFLPALHAVRPVAPWPPTGPVRIVAEADAANEVDDRHALSLLPGFRERLRIEGFAAAHFGDSGGAAGIGESYAEFERVLGKAGPSGKYSLKSGTEPLQYRDRVPDNEGGNFILERARAGTPQDRLWVVLPGPGADAAATLLKEPSIADRIVVFWHGRAQRPVRSWNLNANSAPRAARLLFELPCRLILFDTGTLLTMAMEESERRLAPLGALGRYPYEILTRKAWLIASNKELFDLGDIADILDHSIVRWEEVDAPELDHDLRYEFSKKQRADPLNLPHRNRSDIRSTGTLIEARPKRAVARLTFGGSYDESTSCGPVCTTGCCWLVAGNPRNDLWPRADRVWARFLGSLS